MTRKIPSFLFQVVGLNVLAGEGVADMPGRGAAARRLGEIMHRAARTALFATLMMVIPGLARAQSALDGFDPGTNGTVSALAVQADGKILVGGRFTMLGGGGSGMSSSTSIGRLNADGSLDTGFNPGTDGEVRAIAVQEDGKIVVGGLFTKLGNGATVTRINIGRLNPDGSVDESFDPSASYTVMALAIQPDGKILVGGAFTALGGGTSGMTPRRNIGRLNPDGSLDESFDPGATGSVSAIVVQPDGKIVVAGSFSGLGGSRGATARPAIGRINSDGTLDTAFDVGANNIASALALQPDGKILVGGAFTMLGGGGTGTTPRYNVARLNTDGTIDTSFDPGANTPVYALTLQADGKILVAGSFATLGGGDNGTIARNFIGRLNVDGSLDDSFNPGANATVYALAVQADDKILVGGAFSGLGNGGGSIPRNRIGRLSLAGHVDTNFDPGCNGQVGAVAIQADGKVLVGGSFSLLGGGGTGSSVVNAIGRLNSDGRLDADFKGRADRTVYAVLVQPDGKILVGGDFTVLGSGTPVSRRMLGRFNPDGSVDADFDPGANGTVYTLALQPDGKILVGGSFTALGGGGSGTTTRNFIGRLNTDGSLDPAFNPGANATVFTLKIHADGRILAGGSFTSLGGGGTGTSVRSRIARLNADGSLDTGFDPGADDTVNVLTVQADGGILAGGSFSRFGGGGSGTIPRNRIARINANGSIDQGFDPGADAPIRSIALQADGRILVGGEFTKLGGGGAGTALRSRIGRLNAAGSIDTAFDPGASGNVNALAIQTDGKIVVGGAFARLGDGGTGTTPRSYIGRLTNTDAALQNLAIDPAGTRITWSRGGSSPEFDRVAIERSGDGVSYTFLGSAMRVSGGWRLSGLNLPLSHNSYIRARGFYGTGYGNASGSISEKVLEAVAETDVFAQIASGGNYQTVLTGINTAQIPADILVSLLKSDGTPFNNAAGIPADPIPLTIPPMGTARIEFALPGATVSGYGLFSGQMKLDGTALFKSLQNNVILSEAGVGPSKPSRDFKVYIDNTSNAASGYALTNTGNGPAHLHLALRGRQGGAVLDEASITLEPGQHLAEYAFERFRAKAPAGFEGSIEFTSDQEIAAVALRYDNTHMSELSQVFSTIPVLVDEANRALFFPQIADGGGYRTNIILVNPHSDTATTVNLNFFKDDGSPLELSIGGAKTNSFEMTLEANGVGHFVTDGTSANLSTGWAKAQSRDTIFGSSIFQTLAGGRIVSEAGVGSSPLAPHFTAYVENLGSTLSGIAVCNPSDTTATLTLNLRNSAGEIAATTQIEVPRLGHVAEFFSDHWFPQAKEFQGTLEVISTEPVSAVALRYDNPLHDVFATLPVIILR